MAEAKAPRFNVKTAVSHVDYLNYALQKRINCIARAIEKRFRCQIRQLCLENEELKREKDSREKEIRDTREKEIREKEVHEKERREKELRDIEIREKELRDIEIRDKEIRDKEIRDKEIRDKEIRDKEIRDKEIRDKERTEKELRENEIREFHEKEISERKARATETSNREGKKVEILKKAPKKVDKKCENNKIIFIPEITMVGPPIDTDIQTKIKIRSTDKKIRAPSLIKSEAAAKDLIEVIQRSLNIPQKDIKSWLPWDPDNSLSFFTKIPSKNISFCKEINVANNKFEILVIPLNKNLNKSNKPKIKPLKPN